MSAQEEQYNRVRRLGTRELRKIVATNPVTSWPRHYAEVELRRRENLWTGMRAWAATVISLFSLGISLAAYLGR